MGTIKASNVAFNPLLLPSCKGQQRDILAGEKTLKITKPLHVFDD
jgi:hypothetical protein